MSDVVTPLVYSSPACPYCRQMKDFLDRAGIQYRDIDVSEDTSARDELKKLTGRLAIPVAVIGEKVVVGFDEDELKALLSIDKVVAPGPSAADSMRKPRVDDRRLAACIESARALLRKNCENGRTRASGHLYPHQWNWDSGFISRGYLYFDPAQAYRELDLLFSGQWADGFLPHIIFNQDYLDHFPGPDYWKAETSGRVPPGIATSGISQPPVHADMIAAAMTLDPDSGRAKDFLSRIYPKLVALHDYYFRERDPAGEHLVCLLHPWESGLDNAPLWDDALGAVTGSSTWSDDMQARYNELARAGDRPARDYIAKYSLLVESLWSRQYDWHEISTSHPFLIQDVLFNGILCRSERALGDIARHVGADPGPHLERAQAMARAMNEKLWDEEDGVYYSYDVVAGKQIKRDTIFSYIPLYAGCCDDRRAKRLMENLISHCFCLADRHCVGIPTYDMCQADYDSEFYWRGPVWFNMCWYMARGFEQHGMAEHALWLKESLVQLVMDEGFFEYYEPETGKGLGASDFSWTAALFIDLASTRCDDACPVF